MKQTPTPESTNYALTLTGAAERFRDQHGGRVCFVSARKEWLTWDGSRWKWATENEILRLVKETIREIDAEASRADPEANSQGQQGEGRQGEGSPLQNLLDLPPGDG